MKKIYQGLPKDLVGLHRANQAPDNLFKVNYDLL